MAQNQLDGLLPTRDSLLNPADDQQSQKQATSSLFDSAYNFVSENKVGTAVGVTAVAAAALYLTRGRGAAAVETALAETIPVTRQSVEAAARLRGALAKEATITEAHSAMMLRPGGGMAAGIEARAGRETLTAAAGTDFRPGVGKELQAGADRVAAVAGTDFRAGTGTLKTIDGAAIPDVARPAIAERALTVSAGAFESQVAAVKAAYAGDMIKLWSTPRTLAAETGDTGLKIAERTLAARSAITGEKVTADTIAKEVTRLEKLNPGLTAETDLAGKSVNVWDREHLTKMNEDLVFKHVPQIGQFMKGTGKITEQQIEEALIIQRAIPADQPRKFIGEILVEKNPGLKADVDLAFSRQNEMKAALKSAREKFMFTVQ